MFAEKFLVNTWFIIETFKVTFRYQLDEILVALLVFAKHDQMMRPSACRIPIEPIRLRHIHFTANDRLDSRLLRRLVEADRAEKISMISNRNGRHFVLRRGLGERVVIACAIEKAKAGM